MKTLKLTAEQRPKYKHIQTFEGTGPFPTDMLRYDQCWPYDQEDSRFDPDMPFGKTHRVTVVKYSDRADGRQWSLDRWKSFRWYPVDGREFT